MRIFLTGTAMMIALTTVPVMALQTVAESNNGSVFASGGGSGIFMDKRAPEERDPCNTDGFMQSGGDPKIFKDNRSANAEKVRSAERDGDAFAESGGNPKIFRDEQCANDVVKGGGGSSI